MSAKNIEKINFSQSYGELQKIVDWFEKEEVDLEEGIKKFEQGLKLVGELKKYLQEVENKVKKIKSKFSGEEDFEKEAGASEDGKLF